MPSKALSVKADQLVEKFAHSSKIVFSQLVDNDIIQDIILNWGDALIRLESMVLRIESNSDDSEALASIKRILHTLKGDAGACGLSKMADIFHQIESLLEDFVAENISPVDILLTAHDWLRKNMDLIEGTVPIESIESSEKLPVSPVKNKPPVKILIVDDDFTSRLLLQKILKAYGDIHVAVNGKEAVNAVLSAVNAGEAYDLIILDIMMPEMGGQEALKTIRTAEEKAGIMPGRGVKIIMMTALSDSSNVITSFKELCDSYLVKPVNKDKLLKELRNFSLID